jgi:hypothetical protein
MPDIDYCAAVFKTVTVREGSCQTVPGLQGIYQMGRFALPILPDRDPGALNSRPPGAKSGAPGGVPDAVFNSPSKTVEIKDRRPQT